MRYAQIRKYDVANGSGIRTSIFVTGCSHRCSGCFNEEYQDFLHGDEWTQEQTNLVISYLQDENIAGLSLLGGEPFESAKDLAQVLAQVRQAIDPSKDIWAYSGYLFEDLASHPVRRQLLEACDVLVDGLFIEELKDPSLRFRGSSNQRILDVKRSLEEARPVEYIF